MGKPKKNKKWICNTWSYKNGFIVYWFYWIVYDIVKIPARTLTSMDCLLRKLNLLRGKMWFTFTWWKRSAVIPVIHFVEHQNVSFVCTSALYMQQRHSIACDHWTYTIHAYRLVKIVYFFGFTSLRIQSTSIEKVKRKRNQTWTNPFEYLSTDVFICTLKSSFAADALAIVFGSTINSVYIADRTGVTYLHLLSQFTGSCWLVAVCAYILIKRGLL